MSGRDYLLVVEDDPDLAEVELMILRSAGYVALSAGNGQDALKLVALRQPALILLDMLMPVMDGWSFAREYRARYADPAPIIVLTAAEHAERRADEIGAQAALSKPFDYEELLRVISRFVLPSGTREEAPAGHP